MMRGTVSVKNVKHGTVKSGNPLKGAVKKR